jgi:hypothetical protein
MTQRNPSHAHIAQPRRHGARIFESLRHDPYEPRGKYPASHCGNCGAVYDAGRWQWSATPKGSARTCPACRRIADRMPAGRVTLNGPYVDAHADEIASLVRHEARAESALHPMHRLMELATGAAGIVVTTTDVHLPQRIGEAVRRAYDGDLDVGFAADAYEIRVTWTR